MNTRKFVAATAREALILVRNELGADAVILSNKKVADGVEITVLAGADFAKLTVPNGHGNSAAPKNETRDARAPSLRSPSDGTTSHLTKLQKAQQVIGYLQLSDETTSHSTKHDKTVQVAGYPASGRERQGLASRVSR